MFSQPLWYIPEISENSQLFQEYFHADEDKDNAPGDLRAGLVFCAEYAADLHSAAGDNEGGGSDYQHGTDGVEQLSPGEQLHRNAGEGYSDGEGVNAGGKRKQEHGFHVHLVGFLLLFVGEGFAEHVSADEHEKSESHPAGNRVDEAFKRGAEQVSYHRHKRLESAEPRSADQHVPRPDIAHRQPLTD